MSNQYTNEPMMDMFIFETFQLIEQLEQTIITNEKTNNYSEASINEIFRIMHTIKGSSAMMMFNSISSLAHSIEDLFYILREEKPDNVDYYAISDLVLEGVDFIKLEMEKIKCGDNADGNADTLTDSIKEYLLILKQSNNTSSNSSKERVPEPTKFEKQQYYISQLKSSKVSKYNNKFKAVIYFEDGCGMESIHAYTVIHNLKDITEDFFYIPEDIIDNEKSDEIIRKDGFTVYLRTDYSYQEIYKFFMQTIFLKDLDLVQLDSDDEFFDQVSKTNKTEDLYLNKVQGLNDPDKDEKLHEEKDVHSASVQQSIISVSVSKLDKLMDLVGEMVISEAMVIQNPDLKGLELDNFQKAARQLNKITSEMQDTVMSIRMVPLSVTFHKMQRIVRDMCKKLGKEVELKITGEETEVDKNIIEHISDPLMHLVRNAIDHGIESAEDRKIKKKSQAGTITLEAKSVGSDVHIIVMDDGKGLNKDTILKKARENGLLYKSEADMSDKEIYNLIFLPGFSTKDSISEFSGRGVGMDVVTKNIESVGGSVSVDSIAEIGTTITLKIPLTLAIIDGMNIKVGNSRYTIPTISIKESFRPKENDIITDPDGNEMIMVRGQCYPILRLHEAYGVKTDIIDFADGIMVMVEQDLKKLCIFADELLGQQQVVVKSLPYYIKKLKKISGLTGCTLLGDGSISLILDIAGLTKIEKIEERRI